jgi:hypothetical protein
MESPVAGLTPNVPDQSGVLDSGASDGSPSVWDGYVHPRTNIEDPLEPVLVKQLRHLADMLESGKVRVSSVGNMPPDPRDPLNPFIDRFGSAKLWSVSSSTKQIKHFMLAWTI